MLDILNADRKRGSSTVSRRRSRRRRAGYIFHFMRLGIEIKDKRIVEKLIHVLELMFALLHVEFLTDRYVAVLRDLVTFFPMPISFSKLFTRHHHHRKLSSAYFNIPKKCTKQKRCLMSSLTLPMPCHDVFPFWKRF